MEATAAAVTEQASAPAIEVPSDVEEFAQHQQEANARDLARRRRDAGTPSKEDSATSNQKESQQQADNEASATSQESETASASEAETTQQQEKERRAKTSATSENRFAKITRENKELRERLAKLEQASASRETQQESQPAAEVKAEQKTAAAAKPKIDDKDDKGQPKYKTYEEFLDARDQWVREDIKRESVEASEKSAKAQEQQRAEQVVREEMAKRVEKARSKYADFDTVALDPKLPVKQGSVVFGFTLESPHGTDVLYHLGKNPKELERIQGKPVFKEDGVTILRFQGGLTPIAQVRELSKIESKFSSPPAARKITQAPPPPRVLGTNSSTSADEVEQALKEDDFDSYKAAANARDLARRRGK